MKVDIEKRILAVNDELAGSNRELFARHGVFVLDLMASPGAGKTATILATIDALRDRYAIAVIEGDIASKVDAEKVRAHGIPA
ncbi:MAG: GTP-binding protein, partial [Actinomycetota bacterium]